MMVAVPKRPLFVFVESFVDHRKMHTETRGGKSRMKPRLSRMNVKRRCAAENAALALSRPKLHILRVVTETDSIVYAS